MPTPRVAVRVGVWVEVRVGVRVRIGVRVRVRVRCVSASHSSVRCDISLHPSISAGAAAVQIMSHIIAK